MQATTVDMDGGAWSVELLIATAGTLGSSDGSGLCTSLVGDTWGQSTAQQYVHPKDDYQEGSGNDYPLQIGHPSGIVRNISFVIKSAISGPEQGYIQVTNWRTRST